MFIGWDWASQTHDVTAVDPAGTIVGHWAFAHSEAALQRIFNELAKLGAPHALPVAIERPSGLVVERLLAAGHPVVPVHLKGAPLAPLRLDHNVLAELVHAQVRILRGLLATITDFDRAISAAIMVHPKAHLFARLPRLGHGVNLGQVLSEVGRILERSVDAEQVAAEVGAAPVTRASGKALTVSFRWAANTRARKALTIFADNSRHASPWASDVYARARSRGKRHPHAIRILMRAWIRVIWACWQRDLPYDPTQHRAAVALGLT